MVFGVNNLKKLWNAIIWHLNQKQDKLVSGTNIKTIGGNSVLGIGDIELPDVSSYVKKNDFLNSLKEYQPALLSGTSIKTINNKSLLGEGNIDIDLNLFTVLSELPTENIDDKKVYLIPSTETSDDNIYIEWIRVNDKWEKIGEYKSEVDLSGYWKNSDTDTTKVYRMDKDDRRIVLDINDSRPAIGTFYQPEGYNKYKSRALAGAYNDRGYVSVWCQLDADHASGIELSAYENRAFLGLGCEYPSNHRYKNTILLETHKNGNTAINILGLPNDTNAKPCTEITPDYLLICNSGQGIDAEISSKHIYLHSSYLTTEIKDDGVTVKNLDADNAHLQITNREILKKSDDDELLDTVAWLSDLDSSKQIQIEWDGKRALIVNWEHLPKEGKYIYVLMLYKYSPTYKTHKWTIPARPFWLSGDGLPKVNYDLSDVAQNCEDSEVDVVVPEVFLPEPHHKKRGLVIRGTKSLYEYPKTVLFSKSKRTTLTFGVALFVEDKQAYAGHRRVSNIAKIKYTHGGNSWKIVE